MLLLTPPLQSVVDPAIVFVVKSLFFCISVPFSQLHCVQWKSKSIISYEEYPKDVNVQKEKKKSSVNHWLGSPSVFAYGRTRSTCRVVNLNLCLIDNTQHVVDEYNLWTNISAGWRRRRTNPSYLASSIVSILKIFGIKTKKYWLKLLNHERQICTTGHLYTLAFPTTESVRVFPVFQN